MLSTKYLPHFGTQRLSFTSFLLTILYHLQNKRQLLLTN